MAKDETRQTEGIVTSDGVLASGAFGEGAPKPAKKSLKATALVFVVVLLALGIYVYNDSYRRTTATEVTQVIDSLEGAFSGGKIIDTNGNSAPVFQPQGVVYFIKPPTATMYEHNVAAHQAQKAYKKARQILYRQGLSEKLNSSKKTKQLQSTQYENAFLRCQLNMTQGGEAVLRVSCADEKTYAEAARQAAQFYSLYVQNNPEKPKVTSLNILAIKDSAVNGYKNANVLIVHDDTPEGSATALYYQAPDSKGKWQYFKATMYEVTCDEFTTTDLKKAFVGEACYDDAHNRISVRP